MADTITSTNKLYIGFTNALGKVQYPIVVDDVNTSTATEASIKAVANMFNTGNSDTIIFDSTTAGTSSYVSVETAYREQRTVAKLDINAI